MKGLFTTFGIIVGLFITTTCETIEKCNSGEAGMCKLACNEQSFNYSATFCESKSGNCICDCRDVPSTNCTRDPDSPCNLYCETKNPNPDVFTYIGSLCPALTSNYENHGNHSSHSGDKELCSCFCLLNSDYEENNEI